MTRDPTVISDRRRWLDLAPAIVLLIVSTVGIMVAALRPSGDHGQYAVMAPPWYSLGQTIGLVDTAGGQIVGFGDLRNVVIVHSDHPRFVRALYSAGAWLVIDPVGLRGCLGFDQDPTGMSGPV